jgi:hypothetical protein
MLHADVQALHHDQNLSSGFNSHLIQPPLHVQVVHYYITSSDYLCVNIKVVSIGVSLHM